MTRNKSLDPQIILLYNLQAKHWRRFHIISCIWNVILILFNFWYVILPFSSVIKYCWFVCASYTWDYAFFSRHWDRNVCFKRDSNVIGKTLKDRKQFFFLRYVKCFCCVSVLYVGGCEIPTCGAAMLPATEPHRDVKIKTVFFSVRRAVSLRIQNTRSHIPLCLQFLYTTEGNKGTTVIWLQYHGAPRGWETS